MSRGIPLQVCARCGSAFFPHRLACSVCGSADLDIEATEQGTVEEVTLVHRVVGANPDVPVAIASVLLDRNTRIVARVAPGTRPGAVVRLALYDGGPVAVTA